MPRPQKALSARVSERRKGNLPQRNFRTDIRRLLPQRFRWLIPKRATPQSKSAEPTHSSRGRISSPTTTSDPASSSRFMLPQSRKREQQAMQAFQEDTPALSRDFLKPRFPKFTTALLRLCPFQGRPAQEQRLRSTARTKMLTPSEPASDRGVSASIIL